MKNKKIKIEIIKVYGAEPDCHKAITELWISGTYVIWGDFYHDKI